MSHWKDRFIWSAFALGLAAWVLAQGIVFADKERNMRVERLASWNTERVDEDTIRFRGAGQPFQGAWVSQGLAVQANTIQGLAVRNARGAFELRQATIAGGVRATLVQATDEGQRETLLVGPSVEYRASAESANARILGGATIDSAVAQTGERMRLSGSAASITLPALGQRAEFPILAATLEGPVRFGLTRPREVTENGAKITRTVTVEGTASRATYDDASKTLTLVGRVVVTGDDTVVGGRAEADRAVIRLDDERKVKAIDLTGAPGTSTFRDRSRLR